jgi:hypothetical protein
MKSLAIIPLGLGIMLAAIPARADETSCTGSLVGVTINGNLVVPDGATCSLTNMRVTGNVLVGTGATLNVPGGNVTISGNLQANQCKNVFIRTIGGPVTVGGNVAIQSCTPPVSPGLGYNTNPGASLTIAGNFLCQSNSGPVGAVGGSIGGNANVSQNTGGTSLVAGNTIGGNLLCFGNTGVRGSNTNTVEGKKLGQCAGP